MELLGCSRDFFLEHLQKTAITNGYLNFNVQDFSGYEFHVDHQIPVIAWNNNCSYHQKLCWHYSNLQILSADENLNKSDKMDYEVNVKENMKKLAA